MRIYSKVRDWVDCVLRDSGIRVERALLPAMVPALVFLLDQNTATWWLFGLWFVLWNAFVIWRWCVVLKLESAIADRKFDREGKYKLSQDYWTTESATAAADRDAKGNCSSTHFASESTNRSDSSS